MVTLFTSPFPYHASPIPFHSPSPFHYDASASPPFLLPTLDLPTPPSSVTSRMSRYHALAAHDLDLGLRYLPPLPPPSLHPSPLLFPSHSPYLSLSSASPPPSPTPHPPHPAPSPFPITARNLHRLQAEQQRTAQDAERVQLEQQRRQRMDRARRRRLEELRRAKEERQRQAQAEAQVAPSPVADGSASSSAFPSPAAPHLRARAGRPAWQVVTAADSAALQRQHDEQWRDEQRLQLIRSHTSHLRTKLRQTGGNRSRSPVKGSTGAGSPVKRRHPWLERYAEIHEGMKKVGGGERRRHSIARPPEAYANVPSHARGEQQREEQERTTTGRGKGESSEQQRRSSTGGRGRGALPGRDRRDEEVQVDPPSSEESTAAIHPTDLTALLPLIQSELARYLPLPQPPPPAPPSLLLRFGQLSALERMDDLVASTLDRLLADTVAELGRVEEEERVGREGTRVKGVMKQVEDVLEEWEHTADRVRRRWVDDGGDGPVPMEEAEGRGQEQEERGVRVELEEVEWGRGGPSDREEAVRELCGSAEDVSVRHGSEGGEEVRRRVEGWGDAWVRGLVEQVASEVWQCLDGVVERMVQLHVVDDEQQLPTPHAHVES